MADMAEELWAVVADMPTYEVSTEGRLRSLKGRYRKLTPGPSGYVQVGLAKPGGGYLMRLVHRLVAEAFVANPLALPQVHHRNLNRSDNRAENLEWVSAQENSAARNNGVKHKTRERAIVQLSTDGEFIREWESTKEAAAAVEVSRGQIQACLVGRHQTSRGFRWVYAETHQAPNLQGEGGGEEEQEEEEWREVEDRGASFAVSSLGRVRLPRSGVITFGARSPYGYRTVLSAEKTHHSVHRLVALAFVEKSPEAAIVDHLNGKKDDNRSLNLEWVSQKENIQRAVHTGLTRTTQVRGFQGGKWHYHPSIAAASIATGIPACAISVAQRKRRSAGGFVWAPVFTARPNADATARDKVPELAPGESIGDDDPLWQELGL